ncbi:MAG TPA: beta-galactosidase [Myxococcota bacterium]|jgi:hypothetical protein|nr:beta-galactosidase [Myxococcota bacterium]
MSARAAWLGAALLAAATGCDDGADAPAPPAPPGPVAPFAVTPDALLVDGVPTLVLGADILYYRMNPEDWRDRLTKARALGFTVLQTYVPWNFHEPVEGAFDFESPDHDLAAYLDLAGALGFKVILRPGPHVFNEWDGGGEPAWLFTRAAERLAADGLVAFRDADPDYLDYVARFFARVDEIARPRLVTADPPGPILLYQLDNEYDFFALLKEVSTFNVLGVDAADAGARVAEYFAALRDIVRADGIDVQLITCPTGNIDADGRILSFTGDVPEILPAANLYEYLDSQTEVPSPPSETAVTIEADVARRVTEMHDADGVFHGGAYRGYPSFSAETDNSVTGLARHVFGGNEGAVMFNFIGASTPHFMHMVSFDAAAGLSATALVNPATSYYPNLIDFRAPIAPSGALRPTAFELRRLNGFFGAFGAAIASAGEARRDGPNRNDGGALRLDERNALTGEALCAERDVAGETRWACGLDGLGAPEAPAAAIDLDPGSDLEVIDLIYDTLQNLAPVFPSERAVYWLRGAGGESFVWLFNPHDYPIETTVTLDGADFPRFSTFTVSPGEGSGGAAHEQWGWAALPVNAALGAGLPRLGYTTSQVLALRDFGGRRLLVVYGEEGTQGEIRLDGGFGADGAAPQVLANDLAGFALDVHERGLWVFHYDHAEDRALVLRYPGGAELEIVTTTRAEAGHWWFGRDAAGRDLALTDAAYVEPPARNGGVLALEAWRRPGATSARLFTPVRPVEVRAPGGATVDPAAWEETTWRLEAGPLPAAPAAAALGALPALEPGLTALVEDDLPNERAPGFDFAEAAAAGPYAALDGGPAPLEAPAVGVLRGHAWYASTFDLPGGAAPAAASVRVEGAADFVSVYVNGAYAGTVATQGAPSPYDPGAPGFTGDALNLAFDPALLVAGINALSFRVQVWGHGEAYFPTFADASRLLDQFEQDTGFPLPIDIRFVLPDYMIYSLRGLWGVDDVTPDYALMLMPYQDPTEPASAAAEVVLDGVAVPLDGAWTVTAGESDGPGGLLDGTGRLYGERLGFTAPLFDEAAFAADPRFGAAFAPASLPLATGDGNTVWLRTSFDTDALPRAAAGAMLPLSLELGGRSVCVAAWLNGRFVGRWISDTGWLAQGAPARPVRDQFIPPEASPDQLPLSAALLAPAGARNVLVVVVEDESPPGDADVPIMLSGELMTATGAGALDTLRLVVPNEDLRDATPLLYARDHWELR